LLLAATNHLTIDVAAVPLLWVVPLALYLVTFIIAFSVWNEALPWSALVGWVLSIVRRSRTLLGPLRVVDLPQGRVLTQGRIQHGMHVHHHDVVLRSSARIPKNGATLSSGTPNRAATWLR
jgi:hypothetical protein